MEQVLWKVTRDTALTHGTGVVEGDLSLRPRAERKCYLRSRLKLLRRLSQESKTSQQRNTLDLMASVVIPLNT